ncbi:aspartate/glutamate racemase family protein [Demequina aurantiaca]|uniref:aspartate/glutamate racemase family protein n=1 Tax=Demequina aurantiaca TaxID=676200 RepID=UPI0007852D7F|nr:amino acid racemase [Demequina aurantiaca]
MTRKEIGVIGGVGPAATVEFLRRVVDMTDSATDQGHADLVVLQHSSIPDRTAYVLDASRENPGPVLAADARRLEAMGVTAIVIPCNTARVFIAEIEAAVHTPVVDIVQRGAEAASMLSTPGARVGVLATDGTLASGTYAHALKDLGHDIVVPRHDLQARVTELIYDEVKAGREPTRDKLDDAIRFLREQGAEVVILGCTELSVAAVAWDLDSNVVDALDALAESTIELAGCSVRTRR